MGNEKTPNGDPVENECLLCFLTWEGHSPQGLCAVCKDNYKTYKEAPEARLKRVMTVMHTARVCRVPDTIELVFDHFKARLDALEKKGRYGNR